MTYNFDPDLWYDNHLAAITSRHVRGQLDDDACRAAREKLDRDYEALLDRLDGTYQLPDEEETG